MTKHNLARSLKNKDSRVVLDYIFIFSALIGMIYALLSYRVDMDDFFITLRYAENIASGKGWSFNAGERVLGTTSPLLTLLTALFIRSGVDAVLSVRALSALSLLGASIFCYLYFRGKNQLLIGFGAGLLLFVALPLKQLWGNEVPLCYFFLLGALYFFDREKWTTSAIFQSLYALSRMEGLLFFLICLILLLWKKKKIAYLPLIVGALILVPWFIFSKAYFGDFLPNTLYAKARQGARPDMWIPFSTGFFRTLSLIFASKDWQFLSLCSLFGVVSLFRKRGALLLFWCGTHQLVYWLLGVPGSYSWYYYPLWLLYPILMAGGVSYFTSSRQGEGFRLRGRRCFAYFALLGFVIYQCYSQPYINVFYHRRHKLYVQAANYVLKTYPSDKEIIADEIGILGYYLKDYVILDTAGLIHKDIPRDAYFVYDHLVKTRNPEIIINCRYDSSEETKENALRPVLIEIEPGKKVQYVVEKVFWGDNLAVRILERE